jgi:carbonic anhydrase
MAHGTFGTAINCMDGRTQLPVAQWLKDTFHLDYVDTITEPGADKLVATGEAAELARLLAKVRISVQKHGSRIIAVVGHDDCAGNPVCYADHCAQTEQAMQVIHAWGLGVKVIGLWVNADWQVEVLGQLEP